MQTRRFAMGAAFLAALLPAFSAFAQFQFDYKGFVETDLRMSLPGKEPPKGLDEIRFIRNENWLNGAISIGYDNVRAVADISFVYTGLPEVRKLDDLVQRAQVDPLRIESDSLYIEFSDFIVEGLDLRIGRQIVQWGTADYFNPTNNLNPYDLEDRVKFGELTANEMLYLNYRFPVSVYGEEDPIFDDFYLSFVVVPYYRTGLIPGFTAQAFSDQSLFDQFVDSPTLASLLRVQDAFAAAGGDLAFDLNVRNPDFGIDNMQYGTKLGFFLGGIDFSVSYFHGFDDVPRAESISATDLPVEVDPTNVEEVLQLVELLDLDGVTVNTIVDLTFPRMHVVGADMATSLDFLGGLGLWAEFAYTWHDDLYTYIEIGDGQIVEQDIGTNEFWKMAAGMDYSITSWWYVNAQWVHGFIDEFGADDLNDYLVAGMDFNLFANQMLIRMFAIYQFQDSSYILYPQLTFTFWRNTELTAGAFVYGGADDSVLGSPVSGPSTFFMRARYSF